MKDEESKNSFMDLYGFLKKHKGKIICLIVGIGILFFSYPYLVDFLNSFPFGKKVDGTLTNVSRLELLKILISLISPILTFVVFMNTINMQKKTEDRQTDNEVKQRELENKTIKKEQLLEINNEFYKLLDLFLKVQSKDTIISKVNKIYDCAIDGEKGYLKNYECQSRDMTGTPTEHIMPNSVTINYFKGPEFVKEKRKEVTNISIEKNKILNDQFESLYEITGAYFRVFHRIIKTLNMYLDDTDNALDWDTYKKYIGILRTQISSKEFLVILFNSVYSVRGNGLGIQLMGSGFFGDTNDFDTNQHFGTPKDQRWFLDLTLAIETNRLKRIEVTEKFTKQDISLYEYFALADEEETGPD